MIQVLQAHGVPQRIMAQNISRGPGQQGIDVKTLRKVFKRELADGFEQVKAAIGSAVVKSALGGSVAAQKYWLYCFGGPEWKPTQSPDLPPGASGAGGTTIIIRGGMSAAVLDAKPEPDDDEEPDDGSDPPA